MIYDFEQLLATTRAQLESMRTDPQPGPEPAASRAAALDGKIEVEMAADGRLTGLTLDPAVRSLEAPDLAREIMSAVNQAWAKRLGADEAAASVAAIDPAVLQQRLTELQDQGLASMRRYSETMQAVLDRVDARIPR